MQRIKIHTVFFIILLILGSCRQEEDLYAPVITFAEPEAGMIINLPDTIDVVVQVSDQQPVRTIVLTLVNKEKIPVIPATYFYPDSTRYLIHVSVPITDKSLASGSYNFLVTVSDGNEQKNQYQPVIINEIPAELKGYFVITARFDFKSTIIKLNPAFEPDTQFVFPHGYRLSAVHGMWEEFFFVTPEPSDLVAFNPETFETEWEMMAAPPRPLITGLIPDKELVFSTANGDAGVLSADGNIILRTQAFENKTIQCLAADDNYIYAAHVSLSGDIHELTVFSRMTGDIWEQRLITGTIRSMVPVEKKLLIFLQVADNIEIMDYDPLNFILTEVKVIPGEIINSTEKLSDNQVFIVTGNRVISFDPGSYNLSDFKEGIYKFCRYDLLNDEVFLARDTTLLGFSRNTGDLMDEKFFPEAILDFQVFYNK